MTTTLQLPSDPVPETHPVAANRWRERRRKLFREIFRPAPRVTMSEWADSHRYLSKENSPEPGPWRTDRVPYLREIMDAISDPEVERIVLRKSAQVGYTEGVINNGIGYFIDQDPSPIMVVQPADGDAEEFSKKKLMPMIRETDRIRGKITERGRDSGNTILGKGFPGGFLTITGATSPKGLARDSIRVLFFDEIDRYPASAGSEGNPMRLAEKRTTGFPNRKIIKGSTPVMKGGPIDSEFEDSDQRFFHVRCPHCDHEQVLRWGGPDDEFGIKWEDDDPETAFYLCESCAGVIEEHHKPAMVKAGRWIPQNPGHRTRGYDLSALMSLFDGARWPLLVDEFLKANRKAKSGDTLDLQVWVNTVLGEGWEDEEEKFDPEDLKTRREKYPAEVPKDVAVLTAGVDVQGDRLELAVKGWGADEESWLISHERLHGDTEKDEVWELLEAALTRAYSHESGAELRIRACMIDSGWATEKVYGFVRRRQARGVYASKGLDSRASELLKRSTRANRYGVKLWSIATPRFKDIVFRRLQRQRPGPGYMHFCQQTSTGTDAEYFAQFAAEKAVVKRTGRRFSRVYVQVRDRNEAIDLEVLATAALHSLGDSIRFQLGELSKRIQEEGEKHRSEARPRKRRVRSRGIR